MKRLLILALCTGFIAMTSVVHAKPRPVAHPQMIVPCTPEEIQMVLDGTLDKDCGFTNGGPTKLPPKPPVSTGDLPTVPGDVPIKVDPVDVGNDTDTGSGGDTGGGTVPGVCDAQQLSEAIQAVNSQIDAAQASFSAMGPFQANAFALAQDIAEYRYQAECVGLRNLWENARNTLATVASDAMTTAEELQSQLNAANGICISPDQLCQNYQYAGAYAALENDGNHLVMRAEQMVQAASGN